jgi:hypothetical protein
MEVDPAQSRGMAMSYPSTDPDLLERLGGRDVTDLRALEGYGLDRFQRSEFEGSARSRPGVPRIAPERLRAVLERHGADAFGYTDNVYLPSDLTMRLWREGAREEARLRRDARAAERERTRRLVVIGAPWASSAAIPAGMARLLPPRFRFPIQRPPVVRPYAFAEVVRETAGRLYLGDVRTVPAPGGSFARDPVHGTRPNAYVDRADVMADGVSPEPARRLADAFAEDARDRDAARERLMAAIVDPIAQWQSGELQRDAERDDAIAAILAGPAAPGP